MVFVELTIQAFGDGEMALEIRDRRKCSEGQNPAARERGR